MDRLLQDFRYGIRVLLKNPAFTAVAVMTLALGIGANTAIFSVVNSVLLKPLPYKDPDHLVMIWESQLPDKQNRSYVAPANFVDLRAQNNTLEGMAILIDWQLNLTGEGEPERVAIQRVSADLFRLLGIEPPVGRDFTTEDDQAGSPPVVILSHSLWQRRFGGDREIVGKTLMLDDKPVTVVGVMPASFYFLDRRVEMWVPAAFGAAEAQKRHDHYATVVARLKPGVTEQQAQAEIDTIAARLANEYPNTNKNLGARLMPLGEEIVGGVRSGLLVLLGAVALVLLIACANIANLLLARAASREREIAVRQALGASRLRLVRQLLTESLLLAVAGGLAGLLVAVWSVEWLVALIPDSYAKARDVSLDPQVFGFAAALSVLTGIIFGLVPALHFSKPALSEALKEGGRSIVGGRRYVRSLLVVTEIALALVLLIGAGLLIRSFWRLSNVELGFKSENLLTMKMALPPKYSTADQQISLFDQVLERVRAVPGVESASVITWMPLTFRGGSNGFIIEGRPIPPVDQMTWANYRMISPDFFQTMGITLMRGRNLTWDDTKEKEPVLVISQAMAERYWPGEDPVGKRIKFNWDDTASRWATIVGVAGDARTISMGGRVGPVMYAAYRQKPFFPFFMPQDLVVRAKGDPTNLVAAVRDEVWAVDKDLPVSRIRTMDEIVSAVIAEPRFNMLLLSLFAGLATVLAGVGIYGVMSYTVAQNTHEIGIRMALGASSRDVLRLVVGHGLFLTVAGIAIGLAAAFILTRVMATLLYGVSATDLATFAGIPLLLATVALLACYIPARRATRVDPMEALRYE